MCDNIDVEEAARIASDNAILGKIGDLSNLSTNVKNNIVNSINEVILRIAGEITDRINAINSEHTAWTDAVNAEATARQNADANLLNKINTVKNFKIKTIPILYKDRIEGSVSKLNTYRDGIMVINTISELVKEYRPRLFFNFEYFLKST